MKPLKKHKNKAKTDKKKWEVVKQTNKQKIHCSLTNIKKAKKKYVSLQILTKSYNTL
jgi:hypothetical protein